MSSVRVMSLKAYLLSFFLVFGALASDSLWASESEQDLWNLLWSSHERSKELSYEGVLLTRQGELSQTNRLQHFAHSTGEYEVLERLEGEPVKWIRYNDQIQCVLPARKLILSESRKTSLAFPRMIGDTETLSNLSDYYSISELPTERVAGRHVQVLKLDPKDKLRYEYRLFVDKEKKLLLKTESFGQDGSMLEQVSFTEISFDMGLKQPPQLLELTPGWRESLSRVTSVKPDHMAHDLPEEFHGFRKLQSLCRVRDENAGEATEVHQSIYSDGLSSISVFVQEISPGTNMPSVPMSHGAVTSLSEVQAGHMVTVLGEVPELTIRKFLTLVNWKTNKKGNTQ